MLLILIPKRKSTWRCSFHKMNKHSILTSKQRTFLQLFAQTSLAKTYYLTGGTALAEFYIPYRLSEDLDFFSEQEIELPEITVFIRSIKKNLGYANLDISTSFNRNLIFLELGENETLKTEFTYFPFPQIENPKKMNWILVDSPYDIAVNKLFTIYQKPRSRDFMDLFMLIKQYQFNLDDIIKKARIKFDWNVDFIQLGTQFMRAKELKDYPKLLVPLAEKEWQNYFTEKAKSFKDKIIS